MVMDVSLRLGSKRSLGLGSRVMTTTWRILVLFVAAIALAGCGKSEAEKEAEQANESGRGEVTCSGTAVADPGLPAGFPQIEGATYTEARDDGPTHVVNGYADTELRELYDGYKNGFESAGYKVLFDEIEEDDSEVSYETKDGTADGIVAMRKACDDEGRVSLHITVRPK